MKVVRDFFLKKSKKTVDKYAKMLYIDSIENEEKEI
jgi:hypothetical protein